MRVSVAVSFCALLLAPLGADCAPRRVEQAPPGNTAGQIAPNGSEISARIVDAVMVSSNKLGIEPEQQICVLTLAVTSFKTMERVLPAITANDVTNKPIEVYSKIDLVKFKGGQLTATITMKGSGVAAHLWLTSVLSSTPPR